MNLVLRGSTYFDHPLRLKYFSKLLCWFVLFLLFHNSWYTVPTAETICTENGSTKSLAVD